MTANPANPMGGPETNHLQLSGFLCQFVPTSPTSSPVRGTLALAREFLCLLLPTWPEYLLDRRCCARNLWERRRTRCGGFWSAIFGEGVCVNINQHSASEAGKKTVFKISHISPFANNSLYYFDWRFLKRKSVRALKGEVGTRVIEVKQKASCGAGSREIGERRACTMKDRVTAHPQLVPSFCFPFICQLSLVLRKHLRQNPQLPPQLTSMGEKTNKDTSNNNCLLY